MCKHNDSKTKGLATDFWDVIWVGNASQKAKYPGLYRVIINKNPWSTSTKCDLRVSIVSILWVGPKSTEYEPLLVLYLTFSPCRNEIDTQIWFPFSLKDILLFLLLALAPKVGAFCWLEASRKILRANNLDCVVDSRLRVGFYILNQQ